MQNQTIKGRENHRFRLLFQSYCIHNNFNFILMAIIPPRNRLLWPWAVPAEAHDQTHDRVVRGRECRIRAPVSDRRARVGTDAAGYAGRANPRRRCRSARLLHAHGVRNAGARGRSADQVREGWHGGDCQPAAADADVQRKALHYGGGDCGGFRAD
uniref:(northern house mosquito) hypothetical protein n=2 Tax=Culex pipiens TaxID=7175 RepID=A0A8D8N7G4_CULPI